jgi:hypothetical protein
MAVRTGIIAIIATIGFAVGFLAYIASPVIGQALLAVIPALMIDPSIVFAMITGAAGAIVSTVAMTAWARRG